MEGSDRDYVSGMAPPKWLLKVETRLEQLIHFCVDLDKSWIKTKNKSESGAGYWYF